jgi:2-polyprenyl-6-hydroxyphenyl methylase/3-demethylubiquinone-9 3-methyltransferase
VELDSFARHFGPGADTDYMEAHFPRFCATWNLARQRWKWDKACVLDIGAHWLHQSVLLALDGHRVVAADFADTLENPEAVRIASKQGIERLVYTDLASESVFDSLDEDSVDVVLFCEILEHITFNPVAMWKAVYRVLKPGGRIILTTPNYYFRRSVSDRLKRFITGRGGGITVSEIIHVKTYSPHWKEYSPREIREYFETLSRDFHVGVLKAITYQTEYLQLNWKGRLLYDIRNMIPLLREGIYAEIDLPRKSSGISIQPHWLWPED